VKQPRVDTRAAQIRREAAELAKAREASGGRSGGVLVDPRHEAFAQHLCNGYSQIESYSLAGFQRRRNNAYRLSIREDVVARVAELRLRVQRMQTVTSREIVDLKQWCVDALIDNVLQAKLKKRPDFAGANKALQLLGLHLGMFVDRVAVGNPGEFDELTIADKRKRMGAIIEGLGLFSAVDRDRLSHKETS
jgi:hypothetical protein